MPERNSSSISAEVGLVNLRQLLQGAQQLIIATVLSVIEQGFIKLSKFCNIIHFAGFIHHPADGGVPSTGCAALLIRPRSVLYIPFCYQYHTINYFDLSFFDFYRDEVYNSCKSLNHIRAGTERANHRTDSHHFIGCRGLRRLEYRCERYGQLCWDECGLRAPLI